MTMLNGTEEFRETAKTFRKSLRECFDQRSIGLSLPKNGVFDPENRAFLPMDGDILSECGIIKDGKNEFIRLFRVYLAEDGDVCDKTGKADAFVDQSDINPDGTFEKIGIWIPSFTTNYDPIWQLYKRWYFDWEDYDAFEASFPNEIVVT